MYDKSVENNNKIEKLKENFNKYDDISLYPTIEDIKPHFNLYWLIGFIEAEGSFSIKTQKNGLHFCISQRKESAAVMQSIINYFLALEPDINCPIKDDLKPISNKLYPDNNKVRVFTTTIDFHYWILIPHLLNYPFQSSPHPRAGGAGVEKELIFYYDLYWYWWRNMDYLKQI